MYVLTLNLNTRGNEVHVYCLVLIVSHYGKTKVFPEMGMMLYRQAIHRTDFAINL